MAYDIIHSEELWHFGILGQKWGIRRYQNPDGSYTAAGKARYAQFKDDVEKRKSYDSDKIKSFNKMGNAIQDKANELGEEYAKAFKKAEFSNKQKEEIWKQLKNQGLKDIIDNPDRYGMDSETSRFLYDDMLNDLVESKLSDSLPNDLKQKRKEFDEYQEKYWNEVKDFTDKIVKEYSNVKVSGIKDVPAETRKIVYDSIDTAMPSYISRHFDDYWIYDTDERYDAIERLKNDFSIDEFEKRY